MKEESNLTEPSDAKGPLAWMAGNRVAANLFMVFLLVGGLLSIPRITQEVFPEVTLDLVIITVPYPGSGPEEVEQGVVLAIEEAVRGIDGVRDVRSVAAEGAASVTVELFTGAAAQRILNDITSAVERIATFPADAERPVISLATTRLEVVSALLYGNADARVLLRLAERLREDLLNHPGITSVELTGLPPPEIRVEVSRENLRRYGFTLDAVASVIADASVDLPGGSLETPGGEVLLRTGERLDLAEDFADIILVGGPDGAIVRLGEVADVKDTLREQNLEAYYNGMRAARLRIFRVGEQTPLDVADAVSEVVASARKELPPGMRLALWDDSSEIYADRISLLIRNGFLGLALVLLVLGMFLRPRLAFWVTAGIAVSFMGAFLVMPTLGVSINMISLFAFILVLGIVVDDAIVVGESIFRQTREGRRGLDAAVRGVREVATPVVFSVLTTVLAFSPMLFVPGTSGEFFANIPLIVIPILLLSLGESLFILPAHLSHVRADDGEAQDSNDGGAGILKRISRGRRKLSQGVERFVEVKYEPIIRRILEYRTTAVAAAFSLLIVTVAFVAGGRLPWKFFPDIEGDTVVASLELPFGVPVDETRRAMQRLVTSARAVAADVDSDSGRSDSLITGIYSVLGGVAEEGNFGATDPADASHTATVSVALAPSGERPFSAAEFGRRWRNEIGEILGAERLVFTSEIGPPPEAPVAFELSHTDYASLRRAADELAATLGTYNGVVDVDAGFDRGKEEIALTLTPTARALGLSEADLARQVRSAFYGAEALRRQRGREELRVMVRLPVSQRRSEFDVENLIIRAPEGGEILLRQAAEITRDPAPTDIVRSDGRRVVEVTADVEPGVTAGQVIASVQEEVLPELLSRYPGLSYGLAGEQEQQMEALGALRTGGGVALMAIYVLLAVAFKSYSQPLVVMLAIPFGMVGAIGGHVLMGYGLTLVSILGMTALAGVVVNDSLVLIASINSSRAAGLSPLDAVVAGGKRRFRPVMLTSLTTFFGLSPMIFETSVQARFLVPMAISLGFGVLFVTVIALILVPVVYLLLEDIHEFAFLKRR